MENWLCPLYSPIQGQASLLFVFIRVHSWPIFSTLWGLFRIFLLTNDPATI
jgi:hypothetical protein